MKIVEVIRLLERFIKNPSKGLPEEVFLFVSRITPLINVDLLIKNKGGETLLTWREDGFFKPGWHIPGGIIRYKEKIATRIKAVARKEIGASIVFEENPLAINEVILPFQKNRGHFISLLYKCELISKPKESLRYNGGAPKNGQWKWHKKCPIDIISVHKMYKKFIT